MRRQKNEKDAFLLIVPIVYSCAQGSKRLFHHLHASIIMSRNETSTVAKNDSLILYGDFLAHNKARKQFEHVSQ